MFQTTNQYRIPSGKHTKNYGKITMPFMGKLTIYVYMISIHEWCIYIYMNGIEWDIYIYIYI